MSDTKMTSTEARQLLEMLKRSLIAELMLPTRGGKEEFDVVGDTNTDIFTICTYRGKINPKKYDIGARVKKNGILLLELHIGPTNVHYNPDGTEIKGSHWHIYTEEHGRKYAIPADDLESSSFVDNTILFLERFNVIEKPEIAFQLEVI